MSRTNQGIFTIIKNDFNELESEYNNFSITFFNKYGYSYNGDFFSDFAYSAEAVYIKSRNVKSQLFELLRTTKFEMDTKREEYQWLLEKAAFFERDVVLKFNNAYNTIAQNGLTDVEQRTLDKMSIYRNRGY